MSRQDDEFSQRLRATFRVEAEEHLQAMSSGLLELEHLPTVDRPADRLEAVFRHAHSLKGAARATGFAGVESVCQSLEDVFAAWKRRELDPSAENFDAFHRVLDLLGRLVLSADGRPSTDDTAPLSASLRELTQLLAGRVVTPFPAPAPGHRAVLPMVASDPAAPALPTATAGRPGSAPTPAIGEPATLARPAFAETIRIATDKLDRLLLETEELLAVKQAVALRSVALRDLEPGFTEWDKQWSRIQPRVRELRDEPDLGLLAFLDWNFGHLKTLEARLRALGKAAALDRHEVGRRVDDLLADAKQLVMLPFSTLADLFPKLVRDLTRDQGKDADLVVHGGEVEIDKRILEEMKDPLIHLVRNCIDHGVEKPARRAQRQKPARATIVLAATLVDGNKVEILVSDDGAGIDLARVKEAAVKRTIITADEAAALDDRQAMDLVFQSDVSTSPIITEISGRGLGLAIVREKTGKLGGQVAVENRPDAGTAFRLVLPITLATFRGLLVRVSGQVFVIALSQVERVARFLPADIKTIENRETIVLAGRTISLVRLEDALELPRSTKSTEASAFVSTVVVGAGDSRIAFAVDEVLHDEEVLVKSLGRPLSRVRNIAGATVLASGRIAAILNVADLIKSARKLGSAPRPPRDPAPGEAKTAAQSILLAEDSITSRMLLKGILESAGYRVRTAVDGVDALTALRTGDFDAVVSDIEMPRMTGFDLTSQIRADKRLADLPVVLITALASPADRERGIDVGANAYIVKSSFDQSDLLNVLRRLI